MKDNRTSSIILHNVLIGVLAFIWLIPIVWLVCTSFSAFEGMNTNTFFPKEWSIANYAKLFHPDSVAQFPQWFMNTFIIACVNCLVSTLFIIMVAYATSFMRYTYFVPDGHSDEPANHCIYGYQRIFSSVDGLRIRKDDPERRYIFQVYGCYRIIQNAG